MKQKNSLWTKIKNNRKLRCGGFSVLLTAVVIALIVLLSALFDGLEDRFALQVDCSFNEATTQGEVTREVLAQLDKDVELYTVIPASGGNEDLLSLVKRYEVASDRVTVIKENLLGDPLLRNAFTDATGNRTVTDDCLIVYCPDTGLSRILTNEDYYYRAYNMETGYYDQILVSYEKIITEAICFVIQDSIPCIQILSGHREKTQDQTAFLEQILNEANYQVVRVNLATGDTLNPENPLMLLSPQYDLTDEELNALVEFAKAGGDFFITSEFGDPLNLENFNALLRSYGIEALPGLTIANEKETNSYYSNYPVILMPYLQDTDITHSLLSAGESIIMVTEARSYRLSDPQPDGVMAYPLLITGEAYIRRTSDDGTSILWHEDDPEGKFPVSVWSDKMYENGVTSHMFVIGDSNVFLEYWMQLNTSSNAFMLQIIRSLQEREPISLNISPKAAQRERLSMGDIKPAVIVIVMLPLLILLGALLVLIPRKNL
ncbi:MAG: Gldg family protein [Clostridia bacterium]|nr:Gldg family protein [Clostridia bacterium]